jgi:hypothetical protein
MAVPTDIGGAKMINKLLKVSCAIVAVVLLFAPYVLAMPTDDDLSVLSRLGYFSSAPLEPQLSSDGMTLYNGGLPVVYVADPNPSHELVRIPAPFDLLTAPETATATFSLTYVANGGTDLWGETCYTFPAQAQTSFNAAANIWANIIQSSVPITIRACWADLGSSSILGYSGGGPLRRDFSSAPRALTWYSGSLANALAGSDLDPSSFDMHITYNLYFTWYYGTDGITPAGQYDLMSVVLHEMAHGLNFSGSMSYSGGQGSWGYSTGYPNIYDTYMRDGSGNQLINTGVYANPSTALGTALTSNNIWFHGSNAMAANGGVRVKMYAPSTWSGGSSYSHLDYTTFNDTANELMVYAFSSGESVHDPGPVTKGLLKDLGWTIASSTLSCGSAISLSNHVPYNGTTVGAPSNVSTYSCSGWNESGPEKVHVITTTVTGDITATLSNLSVDLDIFILSACNPSSCVAYGDNSATYSNAPPGTYYIVVDGYYGASGSYTLTVTASNWTRISGFTPSSPALAWNPNYPGGARMQMVVRGSDNSIWTATFNSSGTFMNDWTKLNTGATPSGPALAWNQGTLKMQMAVRGGDDSIWAASFSSSGAFNNDWTRFSGSTPSSPAIVYLPDYVCIVVRGLDNSIWRALY